MHDHWLARESTIKTLWIVFALMLAATVLMNLIAQHAYFGLDGTIGFGAWFGILSCVGMVVFAAALGAILKRPDTYYDS